MKKLYLASQTIAVGLEQVILDRAVYGGDFLEQFATTENKLAMVNNWNFIISRNSTNILKKFLELFCVVGLVLVADGHDRETRRARRRRRSSIDGQQISRHAERFWPQSSRFHHRSRLH